MADNSYFIETEFSDYESEVYTEEQIKDNFISVLRTVDDEDEGILMVMGTDEPVGGYMCISTVIYGDHCKVELYKDFNKRFADVSRDLAIDDAIAAFKEFFAGKVPDLAKMKECKGAFTLETEYTDFPIPVRDVRQIEDCILAMSNCCIGTSEEGYEDVEECEDECKCGCHRGEECNDEECECSCHNDCCCDDSCDCGCEDEMSFIVLQAPEPIDGADFVQATPTDFGWYVEISFIDGRRHQNFGTFFEFDEDVMGVFEDFMAGKIPDTDKWIKVRI